MNLSKEELKAMMDEEFFLLKASVTGKVIELFGRLEEGIRMAIAKAKPDFPDANFSTGKIFRGENYLKYPYIVLDFPKLYSTSAVFAFRTMFWWGHEFSFTLHLQGEAIEKFRPALRKNLKNLYGRDVYLCVNESPWQYHFGKDNYELIDNLRDDADNLLEKNFVKLSRKISLSEYPDVERYCLESYELLMNSLNDQDE